MNELKPGDTVYWIESQPMFAFDKFKLLIEKGEFVVSRTNGSMLIIPENEKSWQREIWYETFPSKNEAIQNLITILEEQKD